jgi:hypothetical protein
MKLGKFRLLVNCDLLTAIGGTRPFALCAPQGHPLNSRPAALSSWRLRGGGVETAWRWRVVLISPAQIVNADLVRVDTFTSGEDAELYSNNGF